MHGGCHGRVAAGDAGPVEVCSPLPAILDVTMRPSWLLALCAVACADPTTQPDADPVAGDAEPADPGDPPDSDGDGDGSASCPSTWWNPDLAG
jgi:hypothetical protein